jgi:hypothetical protein
MASPVSLDWRLPHALDVEEGSHLIEVRSPVETEEREESISNWMV